MKFAIDLPLLKRHAIQLSQLRRLWLVRAILSVTQLVFVLPLYGSLVSNNDGFSALGNGGQLISVLLTCNLVLIYLLQPLSACSAISSERARQTLPLLLISRISPAGLIWQKFLWSLQLVFSAITVSLPAMAFAYSLGGLSGVQLTLGVVVMFAAALQVNSAGIFWSSLCGSSLQAFWGTLLTLLLLLLGPAALFVANIWPFQQDIFGQLPMAALFCSFWRLTDVSPSGEDFFSTEGLLFPLFSLIPPLLVSFALLIVSTCVVSRYRWEAPLTLLRQRLRERLSRSSEAPAITPSTLGNALDVPAGNSREVRYPAGKLAPFPDQPLAARECRASVTSRPVTHVVFSGILIALLLVLVNSDVRLSVFGASVFLQMCVLFLGVLQVQSLASRSIGNERDRETLAVLLTVPINSAEIIRQKLAAASRFRTLLLMPLAVLLVLSLVFGTTFGGGHEHFDLFGEFLGAPASHLLLLLIYWQHLTFALRIGGLCSLITRTTLRSATLTLGILFGYCLLNVFGVMLLENLFDELRVLQDLVAAAPLAGMLLILNDSMPQGDDSTVLAYLSLFAALAAMGLLLTVLRRVIEANAGRWLQRPD